MATVKTTVKTEGCSYSEYRIYPGKGIKFVGKDGKPHLFLTSKCDSLFHQKIKPVRLRWTQSWRRVNKKIKAHEGTAKKRARRPVKIAKPIVGLTFEDMKRKYAMKRAVPGVRAAAIKEARAKQQAKLLADKGDSKKSKQIKQQKLQQQQANTRMAGKMKSKIITTNPRR